MTFLEHTFHISKHLEKPKLVTCDRFCGGGSHMKYVKQKQECYSSTSVLLKLYLINESDGSIDMD